MSDELKALPFGHFIVSKTVKHPMRTKLNLYFKWGIALDMPYEVDKKFVVEVKYANRDEPIDAILTRYSPKEYELPIPAGRDIRMDK